MFLALRLFLAALLSLCVVPGPGEGEGEGTGEGAGGEGEGEGEGEGAGDDDLGAGEGEGEGEGAGEGEGEGADPAVQLRQEREARTRAEREAREAREALEAARRHQATPPAQPQPTEEQRIFEAEEARLRDANCPELERWQINQNRIIRQNTNATRSMVFEARELSDRTDFRNLVANNKTAKAYEKRVEERLSEIRRNGGNLQRSVVLKMLIGDDIVEGRVQSKSTTKTGVKTGEGAPRVPRTTPPVNRSDVSGRAKANERQARAKRLEGRTI